MGHQVKQPTSLRASSSRLVFLSLSLLTLCHRADSVEHCWDTCSASAGGAVAASSRPVRITDSIWAARELRDSSSCWKEGIKYQNKTQQELHFYCSGALSYRRHLSLLPTRRVVGYSLSAFSSPNNFMYLLGRQCLVNSGGRQKNMCSAFVHWTFDT